MDAKPKKRAKADAKETVENLRNEKFYSAHPLTTEQAIRKALGVKDPKENAKPDRAD